MPAPLLSHSSKNDNNEFTDRRPPLARPPRRRRRRRRRPCGGSSPKPTLISAPSPPLPTCMDARSPSVIAPFQQPQYQLNHHAAIVWVLRRLAATAACTSPTTFLRAVPLNPPEGECSQVDSRGQHILTLYADRRRRRCCWSVQRTSEIDAYCA